VLSTRLPSARRDPRRLGINLDFDANDRLLGIEFEADDLASPALLDGAHRLPHAPLRGRVRVLIWRLADVVDDIPSSVRERLRQRRRKR
jgi:hypothetical protein